MYFTAKWTGFYTSFTSWGWGRCGNKKSYGPMNHGIIEGKNIIWALTFTNLYKGYWDGNIYIYTFHFLHSYLYVKLLNLYVLNLYLIYLLLIISYLILLNRILATNYGTINIDHIIFYYGNPWPKMSKQI